MDRAAGPTWDRLVLADIPAGVFAKVDPCGSLGPGDRLAPLNVALMDLLDREHGTAFGPLTAAPDVRAG
jgi:hypothetical protein